MIRLKRNYGNGIEIEVEAAKYTELIEQLSVADELFMDIRCAAKIDGELVVSEKVRFQHRKNGDDHYYEQVCMDGKLKWFKRKLGQHKGSTIGSLFVNTKNEEDPKQQNGLVGWSKYIGGGNGSGFGSNGSSYQQEQRREPPRQEQAPPPRQPSYSAVADEDIPF